MPTFFHRQTRTKNTASSHSNAPSSSSPKSNSNSARANRYATNRRIQRIDTSIDEQEHNCNGEFRRKLQRFGGTSTYRVLRWRWRWILSFRVLLRYASIFSSLYESAFFFACVFIFLFPLLFGFRFKILVVKFVHFHLRESRRGFCWCRTKILWCRMMQSYPKMMQNRERRNLPKQSEGCRVNRRMKESFLRLWLVSPFFFP